MTTNDKPSNPQIQKEMAPVIHALEQQGINFNTREEDKEGLGDVLETTLQRFGITEEKFQSWFNLSGCNCQARKKWLNNIFSWRKNKKK